MIKLRPYLSIISLYLSLFPHTHKVEQIKTNSFLNVVGLGAFLFSKFRSFADLKMNISVTPKRNQTKTYNAYLRLKKKKDKNNLF